MSFVTPNLLPHLNDLFLFFIGTFVSLFSIVDPLMAAPLFVTLTQGLSARDKAVLARRPSTLAFGMLNKKESVAPEEEKEAQAKATSHEDLAFSPLAMPILSGPGAIAVIIGMT